MAVTFVANSEVEPNTPAATMWVAVAVTAWPTGRLTPLSSAAKLTLPVPSVRTFTKPKNTAASPWPDALPVAELKNSMRKSRLAALFRLPRTVVLPPTLLAPCSTGKFCKSLAPASASPTSLALTPSNPRSMPRPALLKIRLPTMALPVLVDEYTSTPLWLLLAMTLPSPADVPPMRLPLTVVAMPTLAHTLPKAALGLTLPSRSVPMWLPCTRLLLPLIHTPVDALPLTTLRSLALVPPTWLPSPNKVRAGDRLSRPFGRARLPLTSVPR